MIGSFFAMVVTLWLGGLSRKPICTVMLNLDMMGGMTSQGQRHTSMLACLDPDVSHFTKSN